MCYLLLFIWLINVLLPSTTCIYNVIPPSLSLSKVKISYLRTVGCNSFNRRKPIKSFYSAHCSVQKYYRTLYYSDILQQVHIQHLATQKVVKNTKQKLMKMQFHLRTGLFLRPQMLKSAGPYFKFNGRAIHQGSHLCKGGRQREQS